MESSIKRPIDPTSADSSAAKRRPPPPPEAGDTQFRLLCPSDKTGAVIGKGGSIVRQIREETLSKIRIDDPVPGSDDRVIIISAPSCFSSGRAEESASPAQQALVRVFERVLEEEKEATCRLLVASSQVGSVLGKGGKVVERIRVESGAQIRVLTGDHVPACAAAGDELIQNSEIKHSYAQDALLRVHTRLTEAVVDRGPLVSARLIVPAQQIGCLLGRGGCIIADMRRVTGANIRIFSKEQIPKCSLPNDEVVQVIGTFQAVQDALVHITSRIRETFFLQKPFSITGSSQYVSAPPEISPLARSRDDQTLGLSHVLDTSIALSNAMDPQPPSSFGVDHLAVDRVPFSYGAEMTGLRHNDLSSPKTWDPQMNSGTPRGIPDAGAGLGFRNGLIRSGARAPIVTNTTVEVVVPQHLLGFVHGENDSNLIQIREISGAKVAIYEPKPWATEGMVILSGSPDQARAAQSLLHAFILCGQSQSATRGP